MPCSEPQVNSKIILNKRLVIESCRMYVLESSGADPWASNYTLKAQLNTYDQFAIDGTYFQHSTGLYHIYSCWYRQYDGWPSNLCITKSMFFIYSGIESPA